MTSTDGPGSPRALSREATHRRSEDRGSTSVVPGGLGEIGRDRAAVGRHGISVHEPESAKVPGSGRLGLMVARREERAELARQFPTGLTILKVLGLARWLAWGWMVAVVAFSGDAVRHPVAGWLAVVAGLVLTAAATWLLRTAPARLLDVGFVTVEGVFALALTVLDGWVFEPGHVFVTSQNLASQWPLIAAISIGVACGPVVAGMFGLMVGPARWLAAVLNEFDDFEPRHVVSLLATSLFYAASGAVFGWLALLLRRTEGEIADRRARDEVARVLHDTVLQTLALVERRTAATDPELADAALVADRELRAFLFEGRGATGDDLSSRMRAAVRQACDRVALAPLSGPRISVNVIDDGCRLPVGDQELLARAVGAAVSNALEHARASNVVVFAETDVDGQVFASVRDDGVGFDPVAAVDGHGLAESIAARLASIGGRAEVRSTPGRGTEVLLWSRASHSE